MKIVHNHWVPFVWHYDCKKCFVNQCLNQLDSEMFWFYIHNSDLLTSWEKEYLIEEYWKE